VCRIHTAFQTQARQDRFASAVQDAVASANWLPAPQAQRSRFSAEIRWRARAVCCATKILRDSGKETSLLRGISRLTGRVPC
jgi:hypothetical protein